MIAAFLRHIDRLSTWAAAVAAACLLLMAVLMMGEVIARSAFAKSLVFSWEFSGYLMGAAFLFGAAYTLRSGGHVRVSLLAEHVPRGIARGLDYFSTLVGIVVTAYILYGLCDLGYSSFTRNIVSFTPTRTPLIIPQGILAIGALLLFLQMLARLIRLFRGQRPDLGQDGKTLDGDP
jgi:TRAP-type C4-dicarboxylate transport system permease small subunit